MVAIDVLLILVLVIVMVTIIVVAIGSDNCDDYGAIYLYTPLQKKVRMRVDLGVLDYGVRRFRNCLQG